MYAEAAMNAPDIEAKVLEIDGALGPGAANAQLLEMIQRLGPFGSQAPEPLFALPRVRAGFTRRVGENHIAFEAQGEDGAKLRAIAFRMAETEAGAAIMSGAPIHLAGRLRLDEWRGGGAVQLEVVDVAAA
jgi:single-stranded-DNA-specific exonuclease